MNGAENGFRLVEDWFTWRKGNSPSVEDENKERISKLGWERTDVLFSFLGIYTIGLLAFYPDKFMVPPGGTTIKSKEQSKQKAYSYQFLSGKYSKYWELNKCGPLLQFLNQYKSIGNVIPIWPGGNADRGRSGLYDLPHLYFRKYEKWACVLQKMYPNSHLEDVLSLHQDEDIKGFLQKMSGNQDTYQHFLKNVCAVIKKREEALENIIDV